MTPEYTPKCAAAADPHAPARLVASTPSLSLSYDFVSGVCKNNQTPHLLFMLDGIAEQGEMIGSAPVRIELEVPP